MSQSKKIYIIYGGPSDEHEVSVKSAKNILNTLNKEQDNDKYLDPQEHTLIEVFLSKDMTFEIVGTGINLSELDFFDHLKKEKVDYVIPMLHGEYGEDGQIQKRLEEAGIKYFGSDSITSRNAMNKDITNKIFKDNNILIPKTKIINKDNFLKDTEDIKNLFNFPIVIKPISGGSSVGLYKFKNYEDYLENISKVFAKKSEEKDGSKNREYQIKEKEKNNNKENIKEKSDDFLLQEFVSGREFTCGVIDYKGETFALQVTEVILKSDTIFDYDTKYTTGACKEITPADIPIHISDAIKLLALKCHNVLGCKDISRTDIILNNTNDQLYVLETNTLPGMTETSFIPAQLKEGGISIKDFFKSKFI